MQIPESVETLNLTGVFVRTFNLKKLTNLKTLNLNECQFPVQMPDGLETLNLNYADLMGFFFRNLRYLKTLNCRYSKNFGIHHIDQLSDGLRTLKLPNLNTRKIKLSKFKLSKFKKLLDLEIAMDKNAKTSQMKIQNLKEIRRRKIETGLY